MLGNDTPRASVVGQILPSNEFYDYKAKYFDDGKSGLVIPADISPRATARVKQMAVQAFRAIDGSGLARVDFFVDKRTDEVYINEINTMPGLQDSMYQNCGMAGLLSAASGHADRSGPGRQAQKVNTALV